MDASDREQTTLILKPSNYLIKFKNTDSVVRDEKYSPELKVCIASNLWPYLVLDLLTICQYTATDFTDESSTRLHNPICVDLFRWN